VQWHYLQLNCQCVNLPRFEEGNRFADFIFCGVIWSAGEGIWLAGLNAGGEIDDEIEFGELLYPPRLSTVVDFRLGKPEKVLVIRIHRYFLA
jgi:hypothetical protein